MCLNLCQHRQLCEMSWKIWAYCLLEDIPVQTITDNHGSQFMNLPDLSFRADSRLTFCTFILYYTASKVKKWQMWHLRCCQVTVQSWGKLDFDWLLVTTVKNKIDLLAVTDDDGWPVAEVDICGSWRRLGFLVHNSWFYFVVISSILSLVVTLYFLLTCAPPESVPLLHTPLTSASSAPPRSQRLSTCTLL